MLWSSIEFFWWVGEYDAQPLKQFIWKPRQLLEGRHDLSLLQPPAPVQHDLQPSGLVFSLWSIFFSSCSHWKVRNKLGIIEKFRPSLWFFRQGIKHHIEVIVKFMEERGTLKLSIVYKDVFNLFWKDFYLMKMCWNSAGGKFVLPQPIGLKMLKITWGTKILWNSSSLSSAESDWKD